MSISTAFLDELRSRTTLSALIGNTVKLKKSGREFAGCCPFHAEKTASFTVNDEKGFYHCFGCAAHGDAVRWLTEVRGLGFIDAVTELAASAGMDMPPRESSPAAVEREQQSTRLYGLLAAAADWYAAQLEPAGAVREYLAARGIDDGAIAAFGLGYAPGGRSTIRTGLKGDNGDLIAAGLLRTTQDGPTRDFFWDRIMIPIRDHRGMVCGFAARALGSASPKYINSPDGPVFDKGRILFNLHRASVAARSSRRLIIVEGQLDVVGLAHVGIDEAVAPMGTALTEAQLMRAWRVANVPVLLFDGDKPGRAAAVRACERAMPMIGPGSSLSVALCPEGEDADSLGRTQGRDAVEAVIASARPLSQFLFDALKAGAV